MKTAEFGEPCAAVPQPGRCRICGWSPVHKDDLERDTEPFRAWADETRTLCDEPDCIVAAKRELGLLP